MHINEAQKRIYPHCQKATEFIEKVKDIKAQISQLQEQLMSHVSNKVALDELLTQDLLLLDEATISEDSQRKNRKYWIQFIQKLQSDLDEF